jgi:M6 family metalloprotease-like protein
MNVQAAAKAGSKCQKSGIKAKVGGNNFICAKSGKKLLWKPVNALPAKVVIDVKKTYSTDDGYYDNFPLGPCQLDPLVPTQWIEMQKLFYNLQACAGQLRLAKYNLGNLRPKAAYSDSKDFNLVQPCKINSGNHYSLMHRTDSWAASRKHPGPNSVIQLIPIYAEDTALPKNTPAKDYEKYLAFIKEWVDYSSDFGSSVIYKIPDQYIKFPGKIADYKLNHEMNWDAPNNVKFNKDVIAAVDADIDFTGVNMVIVVAPAGSSASIMQQAALGSFQTKEGTASVGMSQFPDNPTNPGDSQHIVAAHPFWWIHEAYHAGYGLDDHYGDRRSSINSEYGMGWWTMMTPWGGDLSIWEKWLLGFVQDSQIQCTSAAPSSTYWIAPSSVRTQESKAVVIPISSTKVIVAESIRAAGLHYKVPTQNQGVLIYEIDLTKNTHGMGMKLSLPTNRIVNSSYPFFMADAALRKGDTTTTNEITFTIIESGTFGDVIKVSKE